MAQSCFVPLTWEIIYLTLYVETLVQRLHTLVPRLSNLQKVDNLETGVNLQTTFATLIPNAGPHVLQNGTGGRGDVPEKFRDVLIINGS